MCVFQNPLVRTISKFTNSLLWPSCEHNFQLPALEIRSNYATSIGAFALNCVHPVQIDLWKMKSHNVWSFPNGLEKKKSPIFPKDAFLSKTFERIMVETCISIR